MNLIHFADKYLSTLTELLNRFDKEKFQTIVHLILDAYENERRIFVMGNGGSGATASHFACDINKGCCMDLEKKFKMICLNDNIPTILAFANDLSYDRVFIEQMKNLFIAGDLVIGISGSGNSENVLHAIRYANEHRGKTIGFSGFSGGMLAKLAHIPFVAQINDMQKVEDAHVILAHMIMQAVHLSLHSKSWS
jgi:D-sedoheptulose 7-phosphate isomerase